jgi:hypothetical protein
VEVMEGMRGYDGMEGMIPGKRNAGRRFRVVLRGAMAAMALLGAAAIISRSPGAAVLEVSATPNITKTIGPSERQWMAWENAHGMPKECTPTKEVSVGPHGEQVFTYYADCSMFRAKEAAALKAASKSKQGAVSTTLAGKHAAPFHKKVLQEASKLIAHDKARANGIIFDPDASAARKASAKKALANKAKQASAPVKATDDLEPPPLPSMLQLPKAKAPANSAAQPAERKAAVTRSKAHAASDQMWQPAPFQKKVVKEAAKFWETDKARADELIVDPDAEVGNGGAKAKAKPVTKMARLAAKATGPAAAILEMVSGARSLE